MAFGLEGEWWMQSLLSGISWKKQENVMSSFISTSITSKQPLTVLREALCRMLEVVGVSKKIVTTIRSLYRDTEYAVVVDGSPSEWFNFTMSYNETRTLKKRRIAHPWVFTASAPFVPAQGIRAQGNSLSPHPSSLSTEVLARTTGKLPKHHASASAKSRNVNGTGDLTAT